MPTLLNTSTFMHRETATNGFNNLCNIVHAVTEPGEYNGDVYLQKQFLGRFQLSCDASSDSSQVNINLSNFDPLYSHSVKESLKSYSIKPGCPLLFHATEHHNGLYVQLKKAGKEKAVKSFDSRHLMKGDFVMLRPVATGDFILRNEAGKQQLKVHVKTAAEEKYINPAKLKPVQLTLTSAGFNEKAISIQPFELIIIGLEIDDVMIELREIEPNKAKR